MIIYLIGSRGSGKTTFGKRLAEYLAYDFIDLDHRLTGKLGVSIEQIVEKEGWEGFRRREGACLKQTLENIPPNAVIATGGGIVLDEENRRILRKSGRVFWINTPPDIIFERLRKIPDPGQRPAFTNLSLKEEILKVCGERSPLYADCAHHILDGSKQVQVLCREISLYINGL